MTSGHAATAPGQEQVMVTRLSTRDRLLPIWIGAAMVGGLPLGRAVPGLNDALNAVKVGQTSLPIALGPLLLMMYPVLAKVRYRELRQITGDRRMMAASPTLNWLVGPAGASARRTEPGTHRRMLPPQRRAWPPWWDA